MGAMNERELTSSVSAESAGFGAAAVLGAIHAGFSFYWAAGGTALLWSVGTEIVESFQGRLWLLAPVGMIKLIAAVAPLTLAKLGWPGRRLALAGCWLVALVLILWGGANAVVANLVLADIIHPASGFDRPGMIGHAYLWDPLFLVWGAAVVVGLGSAHRRGTAPTQSAAAEENQAR